jgi:HSP20 family protein
MDLYENTEKNLLTATFELPGLSKNNVRIDFEGGNLVISGEQNMSSELQEQGFTIRERKSGKFVRSLRLPESTQVGNEF